MTLNLRSRLRNRVIANIITLYGVQGCTYVLPLITFPYLARVLRPEGWGAVLFSQAIGAMIAILVEYGFELSATRETARFSEDKQKLRELIAGVLGAKALLALAGIGAALLARPYTLKVAPSNALFWASTLWGVFQGINMLWYFQGLQRMRWAGGLDIVGKVTATISIFAIVHSPADGWKVMASQALGCAVSHGLTVIAAYNEVGFCWPTFTLIREALKLGWPMFLFKASQSLMTSANGVILGFVASPAAVGLYSGADKIRQVAGQAMWPITQALFPHQSQQVTQDPVRSLKTVRMSMLVLGSMSAFAGLAIALGAPLLVHLALGPEFKAAIPALRIFGLLIPLMTLGSVVVFQWMLPLGMDHRFNFIVFTAGLVNVAVGLVLASKFSVLGMAVTAVIAQLYALAAMEVILRRARVSPFSKLKQPLAFSDVTVGEPELVSPR
jgi:PST family polysaccharide transporter